MAKKPDDKRTTVSIELTEDEVYTLDLLLGCVAGDRQVYSVLGKLGATGFTVDPFETAYDLVEFVDENPLTGEDRLIRIKQEEKF